MQLASRRNPSPLEQQAQKVLSYVTHTAFFEHLRNHYLSFKELAKPDLITLLKSAELLRVSEERSMVISFNQPTVCVVVYGQVIAEEKSYSIGKFFIVGQVKLSLDFKEKSLLVMLHKQSVEAEMQAFQDYYFKKKLIEKLIPVDLLKFTKKQMKVFVDSCDFRSSFANEKIIKPGGNQFGLYLLLDGTFSILSKEEIKIGEVSLEYFGEEILWEKDYEFYLSAESVECRFIFLSRETLTATLNANNIKILKEIYFKRLLARKDLQKILQSNINYTRDFMNRMNLSRKAIVINPEYKIPISSIQKRIKRQLNFQNVTISSKINSPNVPSRKSTYKTQASPERAQAHYDDTIISQEINFRTFEPKLYRDQKAKTEFIFRRRVKSEVAEKTARSEVQTRECVADKDVQNLKNLPKTLSVLLKYYESTEKLRSRPKSVNMQLQRGFVPCSKERRIMTTMKLHKEIFMREYFEIKAMEDKAFKTWR